MTITVSPILGMLTGFLISFGLLLIAMTIHEFAHGLVAYLRGDSTAKYSGRLSLNPLTHIDPFWTVILPLFLYISTQGKFVFGAARPVPINYFALKNPKRDIIWVGLSGPAANILLAFILSLVLKMIVLPQGLALAMESLILINIILAVFNLIPIPPLDGSRVVMGLLPESLANVYVGLEPYGFLIISVLLFLGVFNSWVWPVTALIYQAFMGGA